MGTKRPAKSKRPKKSSHKKEKSLAEIWQECARVMKENTRKIGEIGQQLEELSKALRPPRMLPPSFDLRDERGVPPIRDQGSTLSSEGHVAASALGYTVARNVEVTRDPGYPCKLCETWYVPGACPTP